MAPDILTANGARTQSHHSPGSELHTAAKILDLFFYRRDVAVYQWFSPERKTGGYAKICAHQPPWQIGRCNHKTAGVTCGKCEKFEPLPITESIIDMHLDGKALTLGSYQIGQDSVSVKWACLDFDDNGLCSEQELQDAALLARMSLADLQMSSYLEASGGTGWRCHLWVFFAGPLPAIKARVLLDAALKQAGLDDKPFIERFPKQSRALNGYGNLVKVPFGVHRKTRKRSQLLDDELRPIADVRQALDRITTVDPTVVDMVIDLKGLTLKVNNNVVAQPVQKFDYPSDAMNKILSKCFYFRELERQQQSPERVVHYEDWWNYVLMFCRFGDAGVRRILEFSQLDDRFDFEYTINIINYLRLHGYHMPSCHRLREGPGQIHCPYDPLECGAANA